MYKFSEAAARDIKNIFERSLIDFGLAQTEQYYLSLKNCLELLARNPEMGNSMNNWGQSNNSDVIITLTPNTKSHINNTLNPMRE